MSPKALIMTQDQINFIHKMKDYWKVLFEITLCQLMDQPRPKTGNPLEYFFVFSLFLLILCLPNVSKTLIMTQDQINCLHNKTE